MGESRKRERFFVQSVASLQEALGEWLTPTDRATQHESVFFDDAFLTLGGDERAIARRRVEDASATPGGAASYRIDVPKRLRTAEHEEAMTLTTASESMERAFEREGIAPYCAVRWKRERFALAECGTLTLDTEVAYFGSMGGKFVEAGAEHHPRVSIRFEEQPGRKLRTALAAIARLPHSSKRWMGYFRMRKLVKPPRVNELPGYEYEIKLECPPSQRGKPDVDPACLPIPVHRVYQTESTRYYYDGHRIQFRAFRTERATMVKKGELEMIEGVPRRSEEKQRGLSPWELTRPRHVLRRIKKTYLLLHPETERMYNLCLEVCRAGEGESDEMTQVEIEYRGRVSEAKKPEARDVVERAVLADMRAVRDALTRHHGMLPTQATKRSWLKRIA